MMARFELVDPAGGPPPPGPWATRSASAASFSADAAPEERAPRWQISLPADPTEAWAELRAAEASLARQEQAIASAPARLRSLVARGSAASFSAAPGPEGRLVALLDEAQNSGAASFSLGGGARELPAVEERFKSFAQQVQDAVTNLAVVETSLERQLIARTSVSWGGDMRSLLVARIAAEPEQLHRRSLGLALRSRAALLRTFGVVMRGAAIVAVLASSPAGALAAFPAAWRFVDDLLREQRNAALLP